MTKIFIMLAIGIPIVALAKVCEHFLGWDPTGVIASIALAMGIGNTLDIVRQHGSTDV